MTLSGVLKPTIKLDDFQTSRSDTEEKRELLQSEWEFKYRFQLITTYNELVRRVNTTKALRWLNTRPLGNEGESEAGSTEGEANCRLHPLIHTLLHFNLAQDMGKRQESIGETRKSPHPLGPHNH